MDSATTESLRIADPTADRVGLEKVPSRQQHRVWIRFWYSRKQALLLVAGLFLLVRLFGILTPPFQSPDEFNHLKRAYLLSKAMFVIDSRGTHTGGEIDEGLDLTRFRGQFSVFVAG